MANSKHSAVRELTLDRILRKRRGYSIRELTDIVNDSLEFEGFRPVSECSIRRDLENIEFRYRIRLEKFKRGRTMFVRYEDPQSAIFANNLTFAEIQHIRSALMCIRLCDQMTGSLMYEQLSMRLSDILNIDNESEPVVLFEDVPSKMDKEKYKTLYDCILTKTPIQITVQQKDGDPVKDMIVHPYFLYKKGCGWLLLGHDDHADEPIRIPIDNILQVNTEEDVEFIPNKDFPLTMYYENKRKEAN